MTDAALVAVPPGVAMPIRPVFAPVGTVAVISAPETTVNVAGVPSQRIEGGVRWGDRLGSRLILLPHGLA